jgi:hypothetical protein
MDWDSTLLKLLDTNESIELRKLARPGIFTNAETLNPHVTQLITDIEPEEYCLFTAEHQGGATSGRPSARSGLSSAPIITAESLEGLSIDDVCEALDELARMFPNAAGGVESKTAYYRTRAQQLVESIVGLEDTVERQRRELIEYNESLSALSSARPQSVESVSKRIKELENERDQLTEKLARIQMEVSYDNISHVLKVD